MTVLSEATTLPDPERRTVRSGLPGRLTEQQAAELRALYAAARASQDWADLAVVLHRHLSDGVAQTRIGAAFGVSASHVHAIESRHLPVDHRSSPTRDYRNGEWVATAVAARLLNVSSTRLTRRLPDAAAAAITCRAGRLRVWHAESLAAWWERAG